MRSDDAEVYLFCIASGAFYFVCCRWFACFRSLVRWLANLWMCLLYRRNAQRHVNSMCVCEACIGALLAYLGRQTLRVGFALLTYFSAALCLLVLQRRFVTRGQLSVGGKGRCVKFVFVAFDCVLSGLAFCSMFSIMSFGIPRV